MLFNQYLKVHNDFNNLYGSVIFYTHLKVENWCKRSQFRKNRKIMQVLERIKKKKKKYTNAIFEIFQNRQLTIRL